MSSVQETKIKVLFVAEAVTLAHIVRPFVLATSLNSDQFECIIACRDNYPFVLNSFRGRRINLSSRTPTEFAKVLGQGGILFEQDLLHRYVKEELSIIDQVQPDLVVGELRPSLSVSCSLRNVPYLNCTNAYWSPHASISHFPMPCIQSLSKILPNGSLGRRIVRTIENHSSSMVAKAHAAQAAGIDEVRRAYGLSPFASYLEGFTAGDVTLYADIPSLVATKGLPDSHHYIGPIQWSPQLSLPEWWQDVLQQGSYIYLTFGSSGWSSLLPKIVRALISEGHTVVVGGTSGNQLPNSHNLFCSPMLPGSDVCKHAALVICNGGSPTAYQALQHGVPVIGVPANMDQLLFMQHLVTAGVGHSLRADTISARDVRNTVRRSLDDDQLKSRARTIQTEIAQFCATNIFQNILFEMMGDYGDQRVSNM